MTKNEQENALKWWLEKRAQKRTTFYRKHDVDYFHQKIMQCLKTETGFAWYFISYQRFIEILLAEGYMVRAIDKKHFTNLGFGRKPL